MNYIELDNYRCFTKLRMDFGERINLLVGDNVSGKTSLLLAVRSALSAFFLGYSDENTRFLGISKEDFTMIDSETSYMNEKPIRIGFDYSNYSESIEEVYHSYIELTSKKTRTSVAGAKGYKVFTKNLFNTLFDQTAKAQIKPLPLFACFSTEDIHAPRKINGSPFKIYKHKPSFGYYECLLGDGFYPYWLDRLLVLTEKNPHDFEVACVRKAIVQALGREGCNIIRDMIIRPYKKSVYFHYVDGREVEANHLSDGYKRLVNIVMDIAFRCTLLNGGHFGEHAFRFTQGTVLIDEIDLHLHPTLQASVIKALSDTFWNLQFIITTHAPMVMSSVEDYPDNKVFQMTYNPEDGYIQKEIYTFGMDASTIIKMELGQTPRDEQVQEKLDEVFNLIDEEKFAEAKEKLLNLRQSLKGYIPELTQAETMINLMEAPFNEKDS